MDRTLGTIRKGMYEVLKRRQAEGGSLTLEHKAFLRVIDEEEPKYYRSTRGVLRMPWANMTQSTYYNLGCNIHFWHRTGTGNQYALFFHGAGADHRMFESQIKIFDDSYHLVFWDARGHGMSKLDEGKAFSFQDMVNDCRKIYEILGIEKAVIIAQSMGGNLAQEMAYHHPEIIEKMVLIGCTKNTGKLTRAEKLTLKLSKAVFACYPWGMLINQSANACGSKAHVKQYVKDCFTQLEKAAFIDIITAVTGCLSEDTAFRFSMPVLLLCGTDDKSGNIKKSMRLWNDTDENCTLYMIENAGHNANQDEPEIVNRHISDFLLL